MKYLLTLILALSISSIYAKKPATNNYSQLDDLRLVQGKYIRRNLPHYHEAAKVYEITKKNGEINTEVTTVTYLGLKHSHDYVAEVATAAAELSNQRTTFFLVNRPQGCGRDILECIQVSDVVIISPTIQLKSLCLHLIKKYGFSKVNINNSSQADICPFSTAFVSIWKKEPQL